MGVKAVWQRFSRTQVWRAWQRYGDRRGNRLAGATSFFGFLSLFPLIVLAAAVTGKLLDKSAVAALKKALETNLPGIGDKISLDQLIANAGTIGFISGVTLLFTGLGWIDSLRASIRSMHELDDQPGNAIQLKLVDLGALLGLGLIGGLATGASSVLSGMSKWIVRQVGLEGTWLAQWGLAAFSVVVGVAAGAAMFLYLQTGMPRILLPRRVALIAALVGGVLYYLAQKLGNVYVNNVLGNNAAYGALALPLALLVWIYLMTRAIMLIAAWTKEATLDHEAREGAPDSAEKSEEGQESEQGAPEGRAEGESVPEKRYKVVPVAGRQADRVAVAAGAVVGATAMAVVVQLGRAARSLRR